MSERENPLNISPLILNRRSSRAMNGEALAMEELMPLFEAARWAPSAYNNQPWRFIVAPRGNEDAYQRLFSLLVPFNQGWCVNAGALVVVLAKTHFDHNGKASRTHAFDTGAAWENLTLEGIARGLVVHGMEGFDYDRAKTELNIPDDYTVMCMVVIGKPGEVSALPDALQKMEVPSTRKPLNELVFNGTFGKPL